MRKTTSKNEALLRQVRRVAKVGFGLASVIAVGLGAGAQSAGASDHKTMPGSMC